EPARSVALWAEANTRCHRFATSHLGPRYLLLRFEDVCRDPRGSAASIFDFLDAPATNLAAAAACVRPPHTLGRQARADEAVLEALRERAGPALRLFGYGSAR
ncbi:MAG: sulfotransferase, partial [Gemmatimonadota bacterium]